MSLSVNNINQTSTTKMDQPVSQRAETPYSPDEPIDCFESGGVQKKSTGKPYNLVKGKNLTGAIINDHFAIDWQGKHTTFPLNEYDLVLGSHVKALPGKYKKHAVIIHKKTGRAEIYEKTSNGHVYTLYNPQTEKLTSQTDGPNLLPEDNPKNNKKKLNLDG